LEITARVALRFPADLPVENRAFQSPPIDGRTYEPIF
jgi:hypothetical protein